MRVVPVLLVITLATAVAAVAAVADAAPKSFAHHAATGDAPTAVTHIAARVDDPRMCDPSIVGAANITAPCDPARSVELSDISHDVVHLQHPADVVIAARAITLIVDYPLEHAVAFDLTAAAPTGFTRVELVALIGQVYAYIYREEARTSPVPAGRASATLMNRSKTTGTFGVWGHDLGDLVIEDITVGVDAHKRTIVQLSIGS